VTLLLDPAFVRGVIASLVALIFGFGWAIVLVINRTRLTAKPAPLWVNVLFMGGITLLQLGILVRQVIYAADPPGLETWLFWVGETMLAVGTVALLRSFTRKDKER
jgi:hypothetical protein